VSKTYVIGIVRPLEASVYCDIVGHHPSDQGTLDCYESIRGKGLVRGDKCIERG
jgi:hypothetical protein